MDRRLLTPKRLLAALSVLVVFALFVRLGVWQLSRLEERRAHNAVGERHFENEPWEVAVLLALAGNDTESLVYRRARATGVFDPDNEVLIRSQVYLGTAGFHVITPLVGESGDAILINRGWVPLGMDVVPVTDAPPPAGEATIEGWIHETQTRPPLGPADLPDGRLTAMNRVDVDRIQEQVPYPLEPVYLVRLGEQGADLPVPADAPTFDDEGPHLAYAFQWFGFALILLVGYVFLARRQLRSR